MSTVPHLALLGWSPLHPPLVGLRAGQPQQLATVDVRDDETVTGPREDAQAGSVFQDR